MKANNHVFATVLAVIAILAALGIVQFAAANSASTVQSAGDSVGWQLELKGVQFNDLEMSSADHGWAVDDEGSFYQYNSASGKWEFKQKIDNAYVYDMAMVSDTEGWAVGSDQSGSQTDGVIWHYDGSKWERDHNAPATDHLLTIDMASATAGWIVSNHNILRYDGSVWTRVGANTLTQTTISDIDAVSASEFWAVGYEGIYRYNYSGTPGWDMASSVVTTTKTVALAMTDANTGWAVGADGTIWRRSGGAWASFASPLVTVDLSDVEMADANNAWAVGWDYNSSGQAEGKIVKFDGVQWVQIGSAYNAALTEIEVPTTGSGWIFANRDSRMWQYNGAAWQEKSDILKPQALTSSHLEAADMLSQSQGWAVGGNSLGKSDILIYDNTQWQIDPGFSSTLTLTLRGIDMISTTTGVDGWAVGGEFKPDGTTVGTLWQYNGAHWAEYNATDRPDAIVHAVSMASSNQAWALAAGMYPNIITDTQIFANIIVKYNGSSWDWTHLDYLNYLTATLTQTLSIAPLQDLDMIDNTDGWAVGAENQIVRYRPGGGGTYDWVDQPTAVFANPAVGTSVTYTLYAVDMIDGSSGFIAGEKEDSTGHHPLVLSYDDDTGKWVEASLPAMGDVSLRGIQVRNTGSGLEGWAVGTNGAALYFDGSSWTAMQSSTQNDLNAVSVAPDASAGVIAGDTGMLLMYGQIHNIFLPIVMRQPTPTPTNTPPPTATPVPTSTPIPNDELYKQRFNGADPVTTGWQSYDEYGAGSWWEDSEYKVEAHNNNSFIPQFRWADREAEYRDAKFEVQARRSSGSDNFAYGIYVNGNGGSEYYLFSLSFRNGNCDTWDLIRRKDNRNQIMANGPCYVSTGHETVLRVRVERRSSSRADLTVYIDGHRQTKVEDRDWLRGKGAGVMVQPQDNNWVRISFDDFYVRAN